MDNEKRKRGYQKALATHGAGAKAMQWAGYRAAAVRYRELVADLDITGKSVLDVGCGMGDLLPYLCAKTLDFTYAGTDLVPEFIEQATLKFPDFRFVAGNHFDEDVMAGERFDIIVVCGALNAKQPGWLEYRKQVIKKLFDEAGEVFAFNMAGAVFGELEHTDTVAYVDPDVIIDYCRTLTPKLIVRRQYHRRDFTVVMFK